MPAYPQGQAATQKSGPDHQVATHLFNPGQGVGEDISSDHVGNHQNNGDSKQRYDYPSVGRDKASLQQALFAGFQFSGGGCMRHGDIGKDNPCNVERAICARRNEGWVRNIETRMALLERFAPPQQTVFVLGVHTLSKEGAQ
ncbi:hypothetical protein D3C87_1590340 [compost metagenome]